MDFVHKVERTIREEQLLQAGSTIVVAVSGGPDSVALLRALHALSADWGWKLVVAHVNHQFRGEESDREAGFVAALADELRLACEIGRIDVPGYAKDKAMNAQAAAREKRYDFLFGVAEQYGADKIALAHHADDQAETVLMRIIRGTGPSGLTGIPFRRTERKTELIRPLLRIYKSEILQYCEDHHYEYCTDSSNAERKYFRNQVRLDVMPFLQRYNGRLPQTLNRLADMMRPEDDYIEREAERLFHRLAAKEEAGYFFSRKSFLSEHVALQRRLIKLILNYLFAEPDTLDYTKIELIRAAVLQEEAPSLSLDVSERIRFVREYDRVGLTTANAEPRPGYCYMLRDEAGELSIPEADAVLRYGAADRAEADIVRAGHDEAFFDLDKLVFPLTVRSRRDGDRMEIAGLAGRKKVKDIYIDDKIPRSERERIPLIVDADGRVLWIAGVRRSRHALVDENTGRILHMKLCKLQRDSLNAHPRVFIE